MTKKDYELFANKLHRHYVNNPNRHYPFGEIVDLVADVFAGNNPSFDYLKFTTACWEGKHIRKSIKEGV